MIVLKYILFGKILLFSSKCATSLRLMPKSTLKSECCANSLDAKRASAFSSTMNNLASSLTGTTPFFIPTTSPSPFLNRVSAFPPFHGVRRPLPATKCSTSSTNFPSQADTRNPNSSSSSTNSSPSSSSVVSPRTGLLQNLEEAIETVIFRCRFLAILGVFGSLIGSVLCFIKGCTHVAASFTEYFVNRGKVIIFLVDAVEVYLLGTVMLVFGMGLYELFVSNLDPQNLSSKEGNNCRSNLWGLFTLQERPRWLEVKTVDELKTKLGHVIVMLLLIGFFEKCKTAALQTATDLLCFSTSVFFCSGCLFLLTKLTEA